MFKQLSLLLLFVMPAARICSAKSKDEFVKPGPIQVSKDGEKWADKTLKKLSLEEKVGQMLQVRALAEFYNVDNPEYKQLVETIRKYHIGSVIITVRTDGPLLLRNQPYEAAMLTNNLQRASKLPLLFAADFERGLSMRLNATPWFPHAMAFGAAGRSDFAREFGKVVGMESRAIGIQWNFFPVADVNSNPANPIINTRSFGEDPEHVGALSAAYIAGSREAGMLSTAKHFPGHGDTGTDSHLSLAMVGGDLQRLQTVELPPFKKDIDAGVDAIMVAHVTIPALEPDANKVATTSAKVITDLLRNQYAFKGLIVTDAMEMRGLTRLYPPSQGNAAGRAAIDAVKAGNDMILLPSDLDGAYNGILTAVRSGEVTPQQIDASVRRILLAKASVGLNRARLVDINQLNEIVGKPSSMQFAQDVADSSVTLVRHNGLVLPLTKSNGTRAPHGPYEMGEAPASRIVAVIFLDDIRGDWGRTFERELRRRVPEATIFFVDDRIAEGLRAQVLEAANRAQSVIAATYIVPTAGKMVRNQLGQVNNSVAMSESSGVLLQQLIDSAAKKTVVIAMGSPYVATNFPNIETYLCTYSNAPSSEIAAIKGVFGELVFTGKLPVTLPGIANRGEGLSLKTAMAERSSLKEE